MVHKGHTECTFGATVAVWTGRRSVGGLRSYVAAPG